MSDDSSPSWTAPTHDPPGDDDGDSPSRSRSASRLRRKRKSRKRRNPGLAKKLSFVTHLLKTLDLVVFAELSALYYMERSMLRFLVRSTGQYMYLTPKRESFPFMPASRIHVLLIFSTNLLCMLLHIFGSLPSGPDFHRGYQHGGLIIDFIGQRPPTYRLYYLLTDLFILAVQCLMLTVHTQRENLRATLRTFRPLLPELAREVAAAPSADDLDAEERGVLRGLPDAALNEPDGIELRPLDRFQDGGEGTRQADDSAPLLRDAPGDDAPGARLSDIMNSGNAVLGEYHIIHSIVSAAMDLERTAAPLLQSISYGATMAVLQARR